jgi:hypothetical protein
MRTFPSHCSNRMFALRRQQNRLYVAMVFAAGCTLLSGSALAQVPLSTLPTVTTGQARLIEWDLPPQDDDVVPGAMVVDSQGDDKNRIWFVTRAGNPPHAYRMDFPSSLMKGNARWTSWALSQTALITGGTDTATRRIRPSKDRRFLFVRTVAINLESPGVVATVERIDTKNCSGMPQTCERLVWIDQSGEALPTEVAALNVSDVAIDDYNNVFTTHSPNNNADLSYVERLTPGSSSSAAATVTRWTVDGGAGLCHSDTSSPCVAGVAVHPSNRYLVYFSAETANEIDELNTMTNKVKRWSLDALTAACQKQTPPACSGVKGPRQLHIDRSGKVWGVTMSGHLVSLDPYTNLMTAHQMPSMNGADPFGVAPDDDVIGYTNGGTNKVGMLIPKAKAFYISPATVTIFPDTDYVTPLMERAAVTSDKVAGIGKTVPAEVTKNADGTYVEALINVGNNSVTPLGITPAKSKAEGTFFYTVGFSEGTNRVGFVRLPQVKEKMKHPRDDDDRDDGWNGEDHWHDWHDHANSNDDDDDGIANGQDSPAGSENVTKGDSTPLAAAQTADYSMTASPTTLALIAMAEADDPLAQLGIDVYNAQGLLVARSAPALGIAVAQVALPSAGAYTWRVRNYGGAVNYTPTTIVREPAPSLVLVP